MRPFLCPLVCLFLSASARAQQCPIPRDYWPTDGWRHASPATENVDSAMLDSALNEFGTVPANVYAAMVVRHGYVIGERYYHGKDSTARYELRSATKTIVSILTGIAIDKKLLRSIDQPVVPLFPEFASRSDSVDPRKARITIRNLLTMQSGLNWVEGHGPRVSQLPAQLAGRDPLAADERRPGDQLQLQLWQCAFALDHREPSVASVHGDLCK